MKTPSLHSVRRKPIPQVGKQERLELGEPHIQPSSPRVLGGRGIRSAGGTVKLFARVAHNLIGAIY